MKFPPQPEIISVDLCNTISYNTVCAKEAYEKTLDSKSAHKKVTSDEVTEADYLCKRLIRLFI